MELRGIDVSAYNTVTNYQEVAKEGIRVAILRITEKGNAVDPTFERNDKGFREAGIKTGVYKYSYALNVSQAQEEARKVLGVLKGRTLDFPVFYDMEWSQQRILSKGELTDIVKAFREVIVEGGYSFGIYCNLDWYRNVLDTKALPYDYWLAAYPYNDRGVIVESLRPSVGIGWQYSSKGRLKGITGDVDMDVFYKDNFGEKEEVQEYKIWVGRCTGNAVNVRSGPGLEYQNIPGYPTLNKGNLVDVIGSAKDTKGDTWYRVLIAKKYKGYVYYKYMSRN
ncbi:MAG TPA: SH3 domain-containing protein [Candidatus Blautia avistercoris]|uniref:GH25 family lysozyme n=1 Tax=Blautia sp. An249 TaxID=1965603 RepID=UPI000B3805EA|nr:GH25 family lysozyme [Blautia sp. An249]OUO79329.1 hypothetical protein B5F53_07530 [Blautia sp. An249]HIY19419.1 SH3 domain-containing protein [Candidatus Blautia avistercoris]